jgi:hypothetical protein
MYSVEGLGRFLVQTTTAERELLFDADFDLGDAANHALTDLQTRRQVTLPITHQIQLHPSVLLARAGVDSDGQCIISIDPKKRGGQNRSCSSEGIGIPHRAVYYVRIHVKELIAGQVYAVDTEREHEVFRPGIGAYQVFGCLRLEPEKSLKVLDIRGRKLVSALTTRAAAAPEPASYDQWDVPDVCSRAAVNGR